MTTERAKVCSDCRFSRKRMFGGWHCTHPAAVVHDTVTGQPYCDVVRLPLLGVCGPEGKLFEPALPLPWRLLWGE